MNSSVRIVLNRVCVSARVGLADWERACAQRLSVDIELHVDADSYLSSVTAGSIADYLPVYEHIRRWEMRAHTDLIETLASDLLECCFVNPRVVACRVIVLKPDVLDRAQAAGVDALLTRRDFEARRAELRQSPRQPLRQRRPMRT